ncbi:lysM domain receptor-like kinase 3 [Cucurbita maxima]|uniref:LysM domain receptor-like kinase 3 n=1 Tax=Cucurbita maxima TaxID=3661 RepID=A0A6J1JXH6_CUCMA|nr:lysM domain receptor-like kinase 3 [Cucurbita maxima]
MCITKMALHVAEIESNPPLSRSSRSKTSTSKLSDANSSTSSPCKDSEFIFSNSTIKFSSGSFSSLHESLPESPRIFDFSEINAATNQFLNKRFSAASSTPSWRCTLRGKDVMIFQRKFHRKIKLQEFKDRFYEICRSHHTSIIELLGASISGEYLYLVYNFVNGANLSDCLRNSRSPNFTVLSTWISRMQVATDLAQGLDYIHNKSGLNISLSHNHIKSSSILVTEPSFNARICHFGAAQLCNEVDWNKTVEKPTNSRCNGEISTDSMKKVQIKGVRGYMAPEYKSSGVATPMTDVYAFGVVILELLSGEEPLKFKFNRRKGNFVRVSLIESAMAVIEGDNDEEPRGGVALEVGGRLRRWVDRRLKDSFPIHVAEKVMRLAIYCVDVDPSKRPNMAHVASKISKLYLESRIWSNNRAIPAGSSVSLAPR